MRKQITRIACLAVLAASIGFVQVPVAAHDGKHPDAPNPSPNATADRPDREARKVRHRK